MENTAIRLMRIMEEKGLKPVDVVKMAQKYCELYKCKLNKSDISQYLSGAHKPGQNKLFVLGATLDVSEAWLMGLDVPKERDPKREHDDAILIEMNRLFMTLSPEKKMHVLEYLRFMSKE